MSYQRIDRPSAETYQNNLWNSRGAFRGIDRGPRRSAPAELPYREQRGGKWYEGNQRIRDFKAPMYLVRPRDGKRRGQRGRVMDAMTGEGPDVFVMKCGDMRSFMRDRPQRFSWSGWGLSAAEMFEMRTYDKDFRKKDLRRARDLWQSRGARREGQYYDFRDRKYKNLESLRGIPPSEWRQDMRWEEGARRSDNLPLSYRDGWGQWYTRVPSDSGDWPGGRPRNPQ